jgi:hypothetical protein
VVPNPGSKASQGSFDASKSVLLDTGEVAHAPPGERSTTAPGTRAMRPGSPMGYVGDVYLGGAEHQGAISTNDHAGAWAPSSADGGICCDG